MAGTKDKVVEQSQGEPGIVGEQVGCSEAKQGNLLKLTCKQRILETPIFSQ